MNNKYGVSGQRGTARLLAFLVAAESATIAFKLQTVGQPVSHDQHRNIVPWEPRAAAYQVRYQKMMESM